MSRSIVIDGKKYPLEEKKVPAGKQYFVEGPGTTRRPAGYDHTTVTLVIARDKVS